MRRAMMLTLLAALPLSGSAMLGQNAGVRSTSHVLVSGRVIDRSGGSIAGASVMLGDGLDTGKAPATTVLSDGSGTFVADVSLNAGLEVRGTAAGLDSGIMKLTGAGPVSLVLLPVAVEQAVTVTATRSAVEVGSSANSLTTLNATELTRFAALTLDDRLRQHAGFELFRRASGWVQNPTSAGISLRGLGSTAASRTLVLAANAPLNDPFGGWIHWNELAPQAIDAVTIATGGGSDLYGSSAVGGVIDLVPGIPRSKLGEAELLAAAEDTREASGRLDLTQRRWGELLAAQDLRTAGYILTAPAVRGGVDVPANVHFENGRVELDRRQGATGRAFLLGNVLNESRGNGTPLQTNGTRLWRYLAGDDFSSGERLTGRARLFGSDEAYRQTFSAIASNRATELLTRRQNVGTQELGASVDASYTLPTLLPALRLVAVSGVDVRDIRATDYEVPISAGQANGFADTTARQRFIGGFVEGLGTSGRWSGAASVRVDSAANLATYVAARTGRAPLSATAQPDRSELLVSPRVGLVRQLGAGFEARATAFRAFRTPTMNELYRTGQVGQQITLANATLLSERATGAEAGVNWTPAAGRLSGWLAIQATYFWTEINRPVSTVTLSSTPTTITLQRENLGQIQSQGTEITAQIRPGRVLSAGVGYQYANALVTAFSAQPKYVGNAIPQVPANAATAQLRFAAARRGAVTIAARESGRAYDDAANTFLLHGFFTLDLYGERPVGRGFTAFFVVQNLLGRQVDVSRTPLLTVGTPTVAQGGVRYSIPGR